MEGKNPKDTVQKESMNSTDLESCLVLSTRQVSWISAALLLLFFFVFMAGYFLGHQRSLRVFSTKLDQESFSDRIYSALYALSDKGDEQEDGDEEENEVGEQQQDELVAKVEQPTQQAIVAKPAPATVEKVVVQPAAAIVPKTYYYAELAGFGSKEAAEKFIQALRAKNIKVQLKKRQSKTAKGRVTFWYQVITEPFSSKKQLAALVARLKQENHLKDVHIVVKS